MTTAMPYPFDRLLRISREQARIESVVARWLSVRGQGPRLSKLVGGPVRARVVPASGEAADGSSFDPFAAGCIVKAHGISIECRGSSLAVRTIAQRLLGGPPELAAPRPLTIAEQSIWCLLVATALEDLGVEALVWPLGVSSSTIAASAERSPTPTTLVLGITLGEIALGVELVVPCELELRAPPSRDIPVWADRAMLDIPIIVGRCALPRTALDRLATRSLITLEAPPTGAELEILGGTLGIRAAPKALVAEVVTGYLPRDMTLPDAAHVELTVALGTTQLSLRQVFELSIGQIISLGRPLAGPFELRAAGRLVGKGELVDVDGELAVRIVSLGDQE